MRLNRSWAHWLAPLAIGCGDNLQAGDARLGAIPVPGCEAIDHTPCDVRQTACQTRLLALAACLRGNDPGPLPITTLMTEAQFGRHLAEMSARRQPSPSTSKWEWALTTLGLVQPGGLSPEASMAEALAFIAGLYDSETKAIVIVDHGDSFSDLSASIILVHEFVHALQDRHMDLTDFFDGHALTVDSTLAARSIVEGEARLHEARYSASALGHDPTEIDWTRRFQNAVMRDEMFLLAESSPYTAASRRFPYEWGARYLHFAWATGGHPAIHARFASPPATSRTFMASIDAAVIADIPAPPLAPPPTVPTGWTSIEVTDMGAWTLFLVLAQHDTVPDSEVSIALAPERARELALAWRADSFALYDDPLSAPALVWRIVFADVASAQAVALQAARTLGTFGVRQVGTEVTIARSAGGQPMDWAFSF